MTAVPSADPEIWVWFRQHPWRVLFLAANWFLVGLWVGWLYL